VLIRNAEIAERSPLDVRLQDGLIHAVGPAIARRPGELVLDAEGGALLPGLHDHHIHLFALAAALSSLRCGPPDVDSADALATRLRDAARGNSDHSDESEWIRGIGYHESVAGPLDRFVLDRWLDDRPVRIQHRSGALWMLNSRALACLQVEREADLPAGFERDEHGRATGRLFRLDGWLRDRLASAPSQPPDLRQAGSILARFGVTGVTDATPANGRAEVAAFATAVESGALPQRIRLMGRLELPDPATDGLTRGAHKLVLDEPALPDFDSLCESIRLAHDADRAVALHCVTRVELVFALAALEAAGTRTGDRIEHAAVAPPELVSQLAALDLTVVTQPNFIYERGDTYAVEVEAIDRPWLYRAAGFAAAGVRLAGGTDAPFGDPDPWLAIRSAVARESADGLPLGPAEALSPEAAVALFASPLRDPGGPPRTIRPGAPADLCLLDRPWSAARRALGCDQVRATLRAGELIWDRLGGIA
jgi:predicted amidohydrolase YtcJ